MQTLQVQVAQVEALNPLIRRFTLRPLQGGSLPGFSAGAHIRVRVGAPDDWRHYSLVHATPDWQACAAPEHYTIAVRLDDAGRGGSRFMHALQAGSVLTIEPPKNDFPLHAHGGHAVLVAGGIGVTPLVSMAACCRADGRPVRMVYAGRAPDLMAFVPELQQLLGDDLVLHTDAQAGLPLDVAALLDGCTADDQLYVCGPKPLLDAVLAQAAARAWPTERVHFELFSTPPAQVGDHAFEVVLSQSGQRYTVPADQSILECLIDQGCDPMFDCKRGECGVCAVAVLEGAIDHRDYVLSAGEKAAGKVMQICISRAKGPRLVLDL